MSNEQAFALYPNWLTKQYLEHIVHDVLDKNLNVMEYSITPASIGGDNYICQIIRIKLLLEKNGISNVLYLIGKVLGDSKFGQEMVQDNFDVHTIEVDFLTKVLPNLNKYYPGRRIGPECYYADNEKQILFLEDLREQGFDLVPREVYLDMDHCLKTVQAHATLHAAAYLELQKNPHIADKFKECCWSSNLPDYMRKLINNAIAGIEGKINIWKFSTKQIELFKMFKKRLQKEGYGICDFNPKLFNTLTHRDCWKNNMMFKYEDKKVVEVCLLDFQIVNYNCFALDLQYFLTSSATREVRYEQIDDVLEYYYDEFVKIAPNVADFSLRRVKKEFHEKDFWGLAMALFLRPLVVAPKGVDFDAVMDGKQDHGMFDNEEIEEEIKSALDYYNNML